MSGPPPLPSLKTIVNEELARSIKKNYKNDVLVLDDTLSKVVWRMGLNLGLPQIGIFEFETEKQITTDCDWPTQNVKLEARYRYGMTPDEYNAGKRYREGKYDAKLIFMSGSRSLDPYWMEKILLPISENIVSEFGGNFAKNK